MLNLRRFWDRVLCVRLWWNTVLFYLFLLNFWFTRINDWHVVRLGRLSLGCIQYFKLMVRNYNLYGVAVVTPTDRPKSVRNRCVIEVFGGGVFCVDTLRFGISVGVGVFVKGLSQIFFSTCTYILMNIFVLYLSTDQWFIWYANVPYVQNELTDTLKYF